MPKVMVSMPAELLVEVDAEARRLGSNRSAVLRGFAETALNSRRADRARAMETLLADAGGHGGEAADRVKASRPGA
jgi:metal-responsive CopG/Arc/MetJ family transcriptional regulator